MTTCLSLRKFVLLLPMLLASLSWHTAGLALKPKEQADATRRASKAIRVLQSGYHNGYYVNPGEIQSYVLSKIKAGADAGLAVDLAQDQAFGTRKSSIGLAAYQYLNYGLVERLLKERRLKPDQPSDLPVGLLHMAAARGPKEQVAQYIAYGANVNRKIGTLTCLVGGDFVNFKDGRTPLMLATAARFHDAMEMLIGSLADPNIADAAGDTAFSLAWFNDDDKAVKMLLDAGANPILPPSRVAADEKIGPGTGCTPLTLSAHRGYLDLMASLLRAGAPVNEACGDGNTPLSLAAKAGHAGLVRWLLAKGAVTSTLAEVPTRTSGKRNMRSPLMLASDIGRFDIVRTLLVEGGANPDAIDVFGKTPLQTTTELRFSLAAAVLKTGGRFVEKEPSPNQDAAEAAMLKAIDERDYVAALAAREQLRSPSFLQVFVDQADCYAANYFLTYTEVKDFKVFGRDAKSVRETVCVLTEAEKAELAHLSQSLVPPAPPAAASGSLMPKPGKDGKAAAPSMSVEELFAGIPAAFFVPSKKGP